jgi:hypothetical protein
MVAPSTYKITTSQAGSSHAAAPSVQQSFNVIFAFDLTMAVQAMKGAPDTIPIMMNYV